MTRRGMEYHPWCPFHNSTPWCTAGQWLNACSPKAIFFHTQPPIILQFSSLHCCTVCCCGASWNATNTEECVLLPEQKNSADPLTIHWSSMLLPGRWCKEGKPARGRIDKGTVVIQTKQNTCYTRRFRDEKGELWEPGPSSYRSLRGVLASHNTQQNWTRKKYTRE